jgi:hypothetical protein
MQLLLTIFKREAGALVNLFPCFGGPKRLIDRIQTVRASGSLECAPRTLCRGWDNDFSLRQVAEKGSSQLGHARGLRYQVSDFGVAARLLEQAQDRLYSGIDQGITRFLARDLKQTSTAFTSLRIVEKIRSI